MASLIWQAENEIFTLMDRNAHERFKHDPNAVNAMCDEFFERADVEKVSRASAALR